MIKKERVHFIGVGGIGVSALAQYYLQKGDIVSGSDLAPSEITELLKKMGARIFIGKHKITNLKASDQIDIAIYSPAVRPDNPELAAAKKMGAKIQSYPEALGELTRKYFTIAVSGAHGKSTTTSMLALVLEKAGLNPTVVVGTKLKEFSAQGGLASGEGTNFRKGKSKYLLIEADEWQASFLNYWPKIIILTNIDREHLDYYRDLEHIMGTFGEYIGHLPKDGVLVANGDDKNVQDLISNFKFQTKSYSLEQPEAKGIKNILKIPGEHNISNALAVLAAARVLGISDKTTLEALSEYRGAWRRFEEKNLEIIRQGRTASRRIKLKVISDYGHHPNEVKATLLAAREKYPKRNIWCVFQPHQYQRTFYLFEDFVKLFSDVLEKNKKGPILDSLIITDIYSVEGREKGEIKKKVNSKKLIKKINNEKALYLVKNKIKSFLKKNLKSGDILIIMGAGDIYKLQEELV